MKDQYKLELIKQIGEIERRSPQSLKIFLDRNTREDLILKYQKRIKLLKTISCTFCSLVIILLSIKKEFLIVSVMFLYLALTFIYRIEILKHKINLYKLLLALEKEEE